MIIVNQERTKIINFERITEITVSGTSILVGDDIFIPQGEEVAKYETEKRAKEVLAGIVQKYSNYLQLPKVYEMPEK